MTRDDLPRFKAALAKLGANFQREITEPVVALYWDFLKDLDIDAITKAAERHLAESTDRFDFPTVGKLRDLAASSYGVRNARGAEVFSALLGRGPHYDARRGDYWTVDVVEERFGLAAKEAFLAAGGLLAFRDRTDRDVPFLRKAFLEAYREATALEASGALTLPSVTTKALLSGEPMKMLAKGGA